MKKILTAVSAIILFASCQKEISFDDGNNGGGTGSGGSGNTSGLLVKSIGVTGPETTTTLYTYDAQKRLETITITSIGGSLPMNSYSKFIRDNSGRIVKVLQKLGDFAGATSDTAVKIIHYPNATSLDYDYSVNTMRADFGGMVMTTIDSSVYAYAGGKMTSYAGYLFSVMPALPPMPPSESRTDFGYDASDRVITMKVYNDQVGAGTLGLFADYKYTYASTSINNLYLSANGAQNFAMHSLPNTSGHVIAKMETVSNATSPPLNMTLTTSFVNGAGNKPVTATATSVTTGQPNQTTNYTFFYQ